MDVKWKDGRINKINGYCISHTYYFTALIMLWQEGKIHPNKIEDIIRYYDLRNLKTSFDLLPKWVQLEMERIKKDNFIFFNHNSNNWEDVTMHIKEEFFQNTVYRLRSDYTDKTEEAIKIENAIKLLEEYGVLKSGRVII